jgi:ribosomal protein S18 acetylase RimI-like enzyme
MTDYVNFRTARTSDVAYILAREADPLNEYIHRWDEATHRANLADKSFHYLVAQNAASEVIGYAILKDDQDNRIEWLRVVIGAPGKGIGKRFMADVLAYFIGTGKSAIWLDVYQNNTRARRVYSTLGFEETHREASLDNPANTLVFMEFKKTY